MSVARAQPADPIAAGISSLDVLLTGGGLASTLLAASLFIIVLGKYNLLPDRSKDSQNRAKADDEPTGAYRPVLTRSEVEAMIDRSAKDLRDRMDEQHRRVNERDRDREAHILRVEAAQSDLRLQIAGRLASAEADLKTLIREASR